MYDQMLEGRAACAAEMDAMHPMGRIAETADVAESVLWPCSDKAGFLAGHMLAVDGGYGAG